MSEVRKGLSETQFQLLMSSQIRYNQARELLRDAEQRLSEVRALVWDALEIDTDVTATIDSAARELVIQEPDDPSGTRL